MNKAARTLFTTVIFALILMAGINMLGSNSLFSAKPKELSSSQLNTELSSKNVAKAKWQLTELSGELKDGTKFTTRVPNPDSPGAIEISRKLEESGAQYTVADPPVSAGALALLSVIGFPLIIFGLIYFFVLRPAQMGGNQAMSFGRSKAKRVGENGTKVTFEDVAGIDEAKQELFEIVDFLKNTKKYTALGAKIPKGILLTGPPGVGKTHLARAIAGEAGVPFYHISGSDFVEMFVGVGAARVRDLFETAKAHRPSLIFVDEIDAVGRQRGAGLGGGHDEREQTLNQLLVEMDGFDPNSGVIMIAATNRPDVLDPALLRPGRFDRQVVVDAPDANGREAILKIHAKGKPFDSDVDLSKLSRRTPGFTGADLANMLNEGALLAARSNRSRITMADMNEALDRVVAGPQRRSRIFDEKERRVIAFHEAGHAVIGEILENCDPVHKVTILPRGQSLGSTWHMPDADKFLVTKQELLDDVCCLLGGRVAEELEFKEVTTGASNDFQRVTEIARSMICDYGMSDKVGTYAIGRRHSNPFLGRSYQEDRNYSEDVAKIIDEEVRRIVDECHTRAITVLTENREKVQALVAALLERETLDRPDFLKVMAGETLEPVVVPAPSLPEEPRGDEKPGAAVPRLEPGPA